MAIDYDSIVADLGASSLAISLFSSALSDHKAQVYLETDDMETTISSISGYNALAAAAISEKNSLINSILAIQDEVSFSGPAETNESLEAYYE